ncbi:ribonuclease III [Opitutaceae bacterium]
MILSVPDRSEQLNVLQRRLDYTFRNPALLTRAVTHPSFLQQHPEEVESNQRLEFLGDAVLQVILTEKLFARFPTDREGTLSKRRAALTKGEYLSRLAREIGLDHCLRLSTGEEQSGGRRRAAALEDAFEAVIGAVYLDSDLPTTRRVVLSIYGPIDEGLIPQMEQENPKGRLQEIVQPLYGNQALRYEVVHVSGEDHAREYEARVFLKDACLGNGRGPSKKAAEEAAARMALVNQEGLFNPIGSDPPPR